MVQSAIQLAPGNARFRHSLGVVHEAAQQWTSAADAFERAVEKQPADVKVGHTLGLAGRHCLGAQTEGPACCRTDGRVFHPAVNL